MRILIIDDEQYRHDAFKKRYLSHELVHAYHYKEACEAIADSHAFDVIYFDHDLGDMFVNHRGESRELTGDDVARFLVGQPRLKWPDTVVIHTQNPVGAARLEATLRPTGIRVIRKAFDPKNL